MNGFGTLGFVLISKLDNYLTVSDDPKAFLGF